MKRIIAMLNVVIFVLFSVSCKKDFSSEDFLGDFILLYGGEGTVYSSQKLPFEEGYVSEELLSKVYIYEGDFPKNYAIFLNQRSTSGFEVGVFLCEDEDERAAVSEMCLERLDLLCENEKGGLFIRSGNLVIYTTAEDKERAELIFDKIIRTYY